MITVAGAGQLRERVPAERVPAESPFFFFGPPPTAAS
jgi:hypothetical protein